MGKPPAAQSADTSPVKRAGSSRRRNEWWIIGGVLAVLALALLVAGRDAILGSASSANNVADRSAETRSEAAANSAEANDLTTPQPTIIDDDGKAFWASPTHGKPLNLSYLPPGAQVILALRPADLGKHAESEKIVTALGPLGATAIQFIEQTSTFPLREIEQLVIGWRVLREGQWLPTFVVRVASPISPQALLVNLRGAAVKEHAGRTFWVVNDTAYFLPGTADPLCLVIAPATEVRDVIDLAGQAPPLRREIERLLAKADADRHITIAFAPQALFGEGRTLFRGPASALREPLFWLLGDEVGGATLSMHWGDNFFVEFIATPLLELSPENTARRLAERIHQMPRQLEEYVAGVTIEPHGRLVVGRLPEMVGKLAAQTRTGYAADHAALRCYLPVVAGHNLLMATELTLAEVSPSPAQTVDIAAPAAVGHTLDFDGVQRALAQVSSLKFARDTLESALEQLSHDIGVPIEIRGADLQADGITKNQSFGIDVSARPAEQILVEVLRLANPDKTATGPGDQRQKLVYIVEHAPAITARIVVTTRARATERHEELPIVFRAEKP